MEMESSAVTEVESSQDSASDDSQAHDSSQENGEVDAKQNDESNQDESIDDKSSVAKPTRWQKMVQKSREYKQQLQQAQDELRKLENLKVLDAKIRENPKHLKSIIEMLYGEKEESPKQDEINYDEWDPIIADNLKRTLANDARLKKLEEMIEANRFQSMQDNSNARMQEFASMLEADGISVTKDVETAEKIDSLVTVILQSQGVHVDVERGITNATSAQLKDAYNQVRDLIVMSKTTAKEQTISEITKNKRVAVPASGSGQGGVVVTKGPDTDKSITDRLIAAIGS